MDADSCPVGVLVSSLRASAAARTRRYRYEPLLGLLSRPLAPAEPGRVAVRLAEFQRRMDAMEARSRRRKATKRARAGLATRLRRRDPRWVFASELGEANLPDDWHEALRRRLRRRGEGVGGGGAGGDGAAAPRFVGASSRWDKESDDMSWSYGSGREDEVGEVVLGEGDDGEGEEGGDDAEVVALREYGGLVSVRAVRVPKKGRAKDLVGAGEVVDEWMQPPVSPMLPDANTARGGDPLGSVLVGSDGRRGEHQGQQLRPSPIHSSLLAPELAPPAHWSLGAARPDPGAILAAATPIPANDGRSGIGLGSSSSSSASAGVPSFVPAAASGAASVSAYHPSPAGLSFVPSAGPSSSSSVSPPSAADPFAAYRAQLAKGYNHHMMQRKDERAARRM